MQNIIGKGKIYIISPYMVTGGPRTLHQFADKLIGMGADCYVYYGRYGKHFANREKLYSDLNTVIAEKIEDSSNNILIVTESDTGWLLKYHEINKIVWWLSKDFYFTTNRVESLKYFHNINGGNVFSMIGEYFVWIVKDFIKGRNHKYLTDISQFKNMFHMYNCEYAREYLESIGISEKQAQYVCGPIDIVEEYENVNNSSIKNKNFIAYSPVKFNKKILQSIKKRMGELLPDVKFVELSNMTHEELMRVLTKSTIYLDMGTFPGPERIPREAALKYNVIITSNIGAAANSIDIPIPSKYKFGIAEDNVEKICNMILFSIENYEDIVKDFEAYRIKVKLQVRNFESDIISAMQKALDYYN